MSSPTIPAPAGDGSLGTAESDGTTRRRFLTYLVAAPTLAVAVNYGLLDGVAHALPGTPEIADAEDLGDFLIQVQKPTEGQLIVLVAEKDGTVSCALPRMEVGQGITTATAMLIADELALPLDKVKVTLADARPELLFAQITGGSNTIRSVYDPIKAAGAAFRGQMAAAAARELGVPVGQLRIKDGGVQAADGRALSYGDLAVKAADRTLLAPADAPTAPRTALVGSEQRRIDARAMVTGAFKYTNDLDPVPGASRSMVRRAPHIRGSVKSIDNLAAVKAMPGITDVFVVELSRIAYDMEDVVETGVAVVGRTFGEVLDAKEALVVSWNPGPLAGMDDDDVKAGLRGINPGLSGSALPALPTLPGAAVTVVEGEFDFAFVSHAPLESNTAIAHVRDGECDVWSGMKIPIVAQQTIADELSLDPAKVRAHVVQGGGSFGRRLFFDGALEAARISQQAGKPVKHMFTRIDDMRHGRARSASHHRVRMVAVGKEVTALQHNTAFVETDWRHGLGEIFSAYSVQLNAPQILPASVGGNLTFSESVFYTTVKSPYDFGATVQSIQELALPFNTAAWRSVYSPNTRGAEEVMVDELAAALGEDAGQFRLARLPEARQKAVLAKVLEMSRLRQDRPAGGRGHGHRVPRRVQVDRCLRGADRRARRRRRRG